MPDPYADFIHLRVHSSYSLAEGAIVPKDMIGLCQKHNMPAVAITDSCNLFGSLEFSLAASENGIQPIIGAVLPIACRHESSLQTTTYDPVLLLAKNETGYHNLLKLVSRAYTQTEEHEKPHVTLDLLTDLNEGLILLTGGAQGPIGHYLLEDQLAHAETLLLQLLTIFGDRLYIEIMRHGLPSQQQTEPHFIDLAYKHNIPLVATNDVYFSSADMHEAHDALLCIAEGRYVEEENRRKLNSEHYFKSTRQMKQLFADLPEAIENTGVIAVRCAAMSPKRAPILPHYGQGDEAQALKDVAAQGLEKRLADHVWSANMSEEQKQEAAKPYRERLKYELNVIIDMKFPGYFLIVSDFMRWSVANNVPVGPGRESGAGSVVAWSLQITDLDPLRFGLLFERFLNPERVSMPDFDIDFCQEKRERVIHYVQEKYGEDKVAQIITFGKLQARAVLRDVGRVLQMSYGQVDRISKMIPFNPIDPVTLQKAIDMDKSLREMQRSDPEIGHLIDLSLKLEGLNRHCSTHAAGVVIADRPLEELVPVYRDPRSDMPVCGYSMKYAESAGLVKFDFLGLKTLTVIAKACEFIEANGTHLDISKIPLDDRPTYDMLALGDSVGVFQLESAGMRDCLRKMRPDNIDDIIALISLYRPGPMDNIPSYIARKHGTEEPDYLHPMLEGILKETYGVIIYQEQVMQIAQVMGGYSLGGADLLRRAMGKKIASEMDKQRDLFVDGAVKNKVDRDHASSIFDLVAKFAGYGFNKSHAAAYAMISYRTAYLKANFPVEFYAASMNLEINDTDKINGFIQDIKSHDIPILEPNINHSNALFNPEINKDGKLAIRYGLGALKNVGSAAMHHVCADRDAHGAFTDIFNFVERSGNKGVNKKLLENLIRSGALDVLESNRRKLYHNLETLLKYGSGVAKEKQSMQRSLFDLMDDSEKSTPKLDDIEDWSSTERTQEEFGAMGLYLTNHPMLAYKQLANRLNVIYCGNFDTSLDEGFSNVTLAGVVISKRMRSSPRGKFANVNISDPTGIFEISIYDEDLLSGAQDLLESGTLVLINADARKDEGGTRITATNIQAIDDAIGNMAMSYHICVDTPDTIEKLHPLLQEQNANGKTTIHFRLPHEGRTITISLAKPRNLSPNDIANIKSMTGVVAIQEV